MPEIHYIKHLRENEELTISEIAKKTGKNWRTVKKYADGLHSSPDLSFDKNGMMYKEKYGEIVDDWLEEDSKLHRKERRTNKKLFEQLCDEHGFTGSYRTVCGYIQHRRPQLKAQQQEHYERLEHPPGEAQVDFGNMTVVHNHEYKDIKALILSFPYSNAGFIYALPAENAECFLVGLKQLFKQAGGVPTHLRIDNLSAAVVSIGKGDQRTYTDAFLRFQMHYNFEIQACNPASGNEKGNVERKVYYTRNKWFVTAPVMKDFPTLTEWLHEQAVNDRNRDHYEKKVPIQELWHEEQKKLKPMPLEDLQIFSVDSAVVNKYGEILVDKERFVLRKAHSKQSVIIKKEWDCFTCFTNDGEILYQDDRAYMNTTRPIPWEEILGDWAKKPRAVRYSRFFKYLPKNLQTYLLFKKEEIRRRVIGLQKLLPELTLQQLSECLDVESRFERAPHELKLIIEAQSHSYPEKWEEEHTPAILIGYEADLHQYDKKLCPVLEGSSTL